MMQYPTRWFLLSVLLLAFACGEDAPPQSEKSTPEAPKGQKDDPAAEKAQASVPTKPSEETQAKKEGEGVSGEAVSEGVESEAKETTDEDTHRVDRERDSRKKDELVTSENAPSGTEGIVAWTDEQKISQARFEHYIRRLPPFQRREYAALEQKLDLLKNMIKFETLAQMAKEEGLDEDPEVQLALKTEMVKKYLQKRFGDPSRVEVTDEELRARYQEEYSTYHKPERVRASHIQFKNEQEAREAHALMKERMAKPRSNARRIFREFVRRYSVDEESKRRGGDLLHFSREGKSEGRIDQAVLEAAFAMRNLNQISTLIEGKNGWHVVMVTDRRDKVEKSFEDVQDELRARVARDKLESERKAFMANVVDMNEWHLETTVVDSIAVEGMPASHDMNARVQSIENEREEVPEKSPEPTSETPKN